MTTDKNQTDDKKIVSNNIIEVVTPFDEFEHEPLLDEIQGNILKSHGRNHADYLFLKFKGNTEAAKKWIGSFTHRFVTSALEQAEQAKQFRQKKNVPGKIFANFFLTSAGYKYLGYPHEEWPGHGPEDKPLDPFRAGMKESDMQKELGDQSEQWDPGFKDHDIHALVLLAADRIVGPKTQEAKREERKDQKRLVKHPFLLEQKKQAIIKELEALAIADVVHEEIGYILRDEETEEEIEHFGFRDGVSQPLFLKKDIDKERKHSDFSKWDPRAPLDLVLFKDPWGKKDHSYGSFLVFRKLEQNVEGWNRDVVKVARELGILKNVEELQKAETMEDWMKRVNLTDEQRQKVKLVEASAMGRFKDGQPVVLSDHPSSDRIGFEENNFNYAEDLQGSKCPFFAHTRKTNPRGDVPNIRNKQATLKDEKMHRIVRRAINYGQLPSVVPEDNAGLLFMCFQANLHTQFNFMQKDWANAKGFVKKDVGTDIVIGVQTEKNKNPNPLEETYKWPKEWGAKEKEKEKEEVEVTIEHRVTMKGGEFFFAPSMSFLKSLAPEPNRNIVFRGVPIQEIQAAQDIIAELEDYKQRTLAIGLHGDTIQPDKFLTFFNQRNLTFVFYLQNKVGLGDSSAYDQNIETLKTYIKDLSNQEIDATEYKIAELKEYKDLHWAIGLNGDTIEPDGFVNFFGERELPFNFYVQSKGVSLGEYSAYDTNIKTLNEYITKLNGYSPIRTLKRFRLVAKFSGMVEIEESN